MRRIEMEETKTQISTNELLNFNVIEEFDNGESSFLAKKYYLMSKIAEWVLSQTQEQLNALGKSNNVTNYGC